MMNRAIIVLAAVGAMALPGCVSFLPTFDESIHKQLESASTEINKVGAAVNPPYQPAPTFDKVEPYYTAALASLRSAEATAEGRARNYRGQLPARSSSLVASAIRRCREAVEILARLHKTEGVDAQDFQESTVTTTCAIPQMMEARIRD